MRPKQLVPRDQTREGQPCPPQDVEDWIAWIAEFAGGTTGVFEMGKLSKGYGPKGDHDLAEFNGEDASVVYRLHAPHEVLLRASRRILSESACARRVPQAPPMRRAIRPSAIPCRPSATTKLGNSSGPSARDAIACPSFYHGMRAQAVADSILQAAAERRWVDIPDCPV